MTNDSMQPREYDFRITRMRVDGRLAWVVEIRGLGISVHHWDSYDAAVRLAEVAVREHHQLALAGIQKNGFAPTAMQYYGDGKALKETILGGIKSYVLNTVVKQGIIALSSLFIPGAGIIQAAIKLYETIKFIWDKFQDLANSAKAITASLAAIASGNIADPVTKISSSLVGVLGLGVNFLARIAKLDGIVARVRALFDKIKAPIKVAIDKVIAWFKGLVKGKGAKLATSSTANTKPKDPDHDKKVAVGLAQIDLEEAKVDAKDNDGKLTKAQATQVATTIKRNNPIFSKILVHHNPQAGTNVAGHVVNKPEIIYEWFASRGPQVSSRKPYTDDLEPDVKEGTQTNPFTLDWPKKASSAYPKLYLGERTKPDGTKSPAISGDRSTVQGAITELDPHGKHVLPTGETLGISAQWQLDVGTVVGPLAATGVTSPGGVLINSLLKKYGYSPDDEGMDGDHIHEIQLGGRDVLSNLWPLFASMNRSSGSKLDKTVVKLNSGKQVLVYQLREFVQKKNRDLFFKIGSVKP